MIYMYGRSFSALATSQLEWNKLLSELKIAKCYHIILKMASHLLKSTVYDILKPIDQNAILIMCRYSLEYAGFHAMGC